MKNEVKNVELSGIRSFAEKYQSDKQNLFMTIGEPDFNTPEIIKEAANQALVDNMTHYPPAMGHTSLREKICEHENNLYATEYTNDNVIVTNGATESLALGLWSLLTSGDEVLIPTPSFPLYVTQVKLVGAKPVFVDTSSNEFQITKEDLDSKLTDKTKAIVITTPNNPTGTIFNKDSNKAMYEFMMENPEIYLIIDEVYRSILFTDDYPSLREYPELKDRIVVVQSFSKSHAMTGWRVGYVIANEELVDSMHKLHQNMVTGISTVSQKAAEKALEVEMDEMVSIFKKRNEYVAKRLTDMGIDFVKADGALYTFFSIEKFNMSSLEFGNRLAEENHLVLVPGVYFEAEGYMRLSFGLGMDAIEEGMNRLERFVKKLSEE